ncbi:hypothetical protein ASF80_16110 [Microbacterium sp. Leaf159]|nr:hypothetical protein ASF80_16110 [Microbacterium sp. Leaf159]
MQPRGIVLGAERAAGSDDRVSKLYFWGDRLGPISLREWELPRTTLERLEGVIGEEEEWLVVNLRTERLLSRDVFEEGRAQVAVERQPHGVLSMSVRCCAVGMS